MTGRPPSYKPEFAEQAEKLCRLGATDEELADFFSVTTRTITRWKASHEDFCLALKVGKEPADDRVERSLYAKANGYTFDSVKIFNNNGSEMVVPYKEHVPPDTTACIFWLKNRRPDLWRDKVLNEHAGEGGGPQKHTVTHELSADVRALLAEATAGLSSGVDDA